MTFGETPYEFLHTNREVMEYVLGNKRLPKLSQCSQELYDLMLKCWSEDPLDRPTFKNVLESLLRIAPQSEDNEDTGLIGGGSGYYKTTEKQYSNSSYSPEYQHTTREVVNNDV